MDAPVGGDFGGMIAAVRNRTGVCMSCEAVNSCATAALSEPGSVGALTMAGRVARAMQQSVLIEWSEVGAGQQLWSPLPMASCVCCWQIPDGATRVPINRMATAARWNKPCNMASAYQSSRFLR